VTDDLEMQRLDERVVVLAPSAQDGPITASLLSKEGFECALVRDVAELCRAIEEGAAVALVAEEALPPAAARRLADLLAAQEPWSDLPVIVFTGRGRPALHRGIEPLAASGNVTLLERPVERITLVSAVRAALRARRRQYAARAVLTDLERTRDGLRDADRRKSEFLAVLSHELRNPLAPIRNSLYLLERAAADPEQAARAKAVIHRQTQHLTRLVDDLLDMTRISVGKIDLRRTRLDLRETVRRTTDDLHSLFAQARIALRVEYASSGPVWIDADPTRMAQVLGNLLHNAAKFTPAGGSVTVAVAAREGTAELSVRDDGAGMEPSTLERMFEPFAQGEQTLARTGGGLGLGLALVRGLVGLHGGTVEAQSAGVGRGAEFVVRLPLAEALAEPERPDGARASRVPRVVLVIEDNADGAQTLADVLELHGHEVRVARDGRSGIEAARELRPDVVLCDLGLPDVDGYDVARTLRREAALDRTRLVALSGYAQPEDRERAHAAGFDVHLAKPPDLEQLMDVVSGGAREGARPDGAHPDA
jgi:signal transduction histidine kinase/ActR/RegA family two-component response regulator